MFKGSGFYITDNRSENYKQSAKKAVSESKPAAEKTEAKPAPGAQGGEKVGPGGPPKSALHSRTESIEHETLNSQRRIIRYARL